VQISNGYMHAGYPIMVHMDFSERCLDAVKMVSEGEWGAFHELGHNMQRDWWTWDATIEVTVNLFTLYTMDKHLNKPMQSFDFWKEEGRKKIAVWTKAGKPRDEWNKDPFLALYMYAQLIHYFGFPALEAVMRAYEANPQVRPAPGSSDMDKLARWARIYSQIVQRDLTPFFHAWGFREVRCEGCQNMPPWTCDIP
jgi:hypothetical protein